jgi:hypothetical protein
MATEWRFRSEYIKNCNCAMGCPCDFWSAPTHGPCQGMFANRILEGHYGSVALNGLIFAGTYHWPGALHLGNGTFQPYVLDKSTGQQRDAILTIMSGKAGNAWYEVLASVVSRVLEPRFVPIEFEFDLERRHARVNIPGELLTTTEPAKNIATGKDHRVRLDMPEGMEYKHPEIATTGILRSSGPIAFDHPPAHSSLAIVEQTHQGLAGG